MIQLTIKEEKNRQKEEKHQENSFLSRSWDRSISFISPSPASLYKFPNRANISETN